MRTWLLLAGALLWPAPDALAHKPVHIGGSGGATFADALHIEDADVSQVAYRRLTDDAPQLWLKVHGHAGKSLFLQLGVPQLPRLDGYRPALALIGPGLPQAALPFETPPGLGALVLETGEAVGFHEPFSDTDSWILLEARTTLAADGDHYVVAFHPQGEPGKLWIALGEREAFGAQDLAALPGWLAEVRRFHEVGGQAPWLLVLGGALAAVAGLALWWAVYR